MIESVGIIGLGNMGSTIARRLSNTFKMIGYDIDQQKREMLRQQGIECAESPEELAAKVNVLLLSLPRPEISLRTLESVCSYLQSGSVVIETSTVSPADAGRFHEVCAPYSIDLVDGAILGGISHVENGVATLLMGGPSEVIHSLNPVLAELSNDIRIMGKVGTGMAAKIINNAVAHNVMVMIIEAAALGKELGVSTEAIYQLLSGETALLRPLTHRFGERIMNGEFEGGMSTENARKDSKLALTLAQEQGVPLFSIQASHTVYEIAKQVGLGNLDYASIAKLWEDWLNIKFTD
ncbi:6-phosphogluconate dehydrogenase [Pullulanibacillus camelliae]|uniref:6-phosphogluconate dehydrogenase n=1 Tax=Pullulanibacillus camelliae TaxID=1707096 RepID=A0A8J2VLS0_9BACL|nr:NAD(P)-dependent oxidoreductase [Pullulanibacillus camelliae]GGE27715.1 6-phosphogluconate dehydrogenase [Pullulanibacillus camelliae]